MREQVLSCYRKLLRGVSSLPRRTQGYYRNYVRENFVSWSDEEDESKIQVLIDKAYDDMKYILSKCSSSPAATRSATTTPFKQNVQWWHGAVLLLVWAFFSSGTIFLNKHLYTSGGFPYPLASTAIGQLTTAAGGYVLLLLGIFPRKPLPHPAQIVTKLVPAALSTSGTLFAGNYAYLTLSVAFMQMMKGFTPGLTLILAVAFGKERFSFRLSVAVLAVCLGTAATALLERRSLHFSTKGMLWMVLSSCSECLRVVMIQTVGETRSGAQPPTPPTARARYATFRRGSPMNGELEVPCTPRAEQVLGPRTTGVRNSPERDPPSTPTVANIQHPANEPMSLDLAETLMYVSGPASVILGVLSSVIERQGVVQALLGARSGVGQCADGERCAELIRTGSITYTLLLLAAVAMSSLLTNLSGYAAVQATSSLTFKIVGVAKNLAVIGGGMLQGEHVGGLQLCAYLVSSIGTLYYSIVRSRLIRGCRDPKDKCE